MAGRILERGLLVLAGAAVTLLLAWTLGRDEPDLRAGSGVYSNEAYINGLYTNMNLVSSEDVLRHVFNSLPEHAVVYPSENYYYFRFSGRGHSVAGALWLGVQKIDSGLVGFSFTRKPEARDRFADPRRTPLYRDFGAAEGVTVRRIDDFNVEIEFEQKTVHFELYRAPLQPGDHYLLRADEQFVGPSFDESGLRFDLLFNSTLQRLFWVLNEDHFVPEQFTALSSRVSVGERSEFVFYIDSLNRRKILIGVNRLNVADNTWYDGPFDQMPDNYVHAGLTDMRARLAQHHEVDAQRLDEYGFVLPRKMTRLGADAYCRYDKREVFEFVDSLAPLSTENYPAFLAEITAPRRR